MRLLLLFGVALCLRAQGNLEILSHGRPILDAHNCYPYEGRWSDRIDRALAVGYPVSIEQDLAWYVDSAGRGRAIIAHDPKAMMGAEPTLRDHFFERVRPLVEKALHEGNREQWPLVILHLDFKMNDTPLLKATWDLLGEYETWITTAAKRAQASQLAPLERKPILVLTEDSDAQEAVFFNSVPVGGKLRLFGSAHNSRVPGTSDEERLHFASTLPPEQLLTERPTNYRRWWNNPWAVVEEGGQVRAGDWTVKDAARLRALVEHAHRLGFWSRFFTLDGFSSLEDRGWDRNYNFGSREAAILRWQAAIDAGVDFISTDQYEDLAMIMGRSVNPPKAVIAPPPGIRWIAHRGGVVDARYAENSPASLEAAVTHGYSKIEVDVRETKDGRVIMQHDPDFAHFYGDPRKVIDMTLAEARTLRAQPGGTPPMTFTELADASRGRLGLMMDIKVPGRAPAFLQEIERELSRTGLLASAYFIDLPEARAYFKGKARVSATFQQLQEAVRQGEDVGKLYFLFEWGRTLTEAQVRFSQQHGVPVVPTVNTFHYDNTGADPIAAGIADIRKLRDLGVTEFQMDSVYEPAFAPTAADSSRSDH